MRMPPEKSQEEKKNVSCRKKKKKNHDLCGEKARENPVSSQHERFLIE
jgi:hypothetical protein